MYCSFYSAVVIFDFHSRHNYQLIYAYIRSPLSVFHFRGSARGRLVVFGNVVVGQRRRGANVRRRSERCSSRNGPRPALPPSRGTRLPMAQSCCSPRTGPGWWLALPPQVFSAPPSSPRVPLGPAMVSRRRTSLSMCLSDSVAYIALHASLSFVR